VNGSAGRAVTIREATDNDARSISTLLGQLGYATDAATVPGRLRSINAEQGTAFVAVGENGEALGLIALAAHAVLHAAGPVGLITALVVADAARGRGVGRLLVERAKEWAAARGCVRLIVTSGEQRADAHAFYVACGLPQTGRRFGVSIGQP
jgi:GNAT superfamily N-acetyltransferase